MSLRNYATTLYNWLNGFVPTYREPVIFDADNPQPNEYITYSASTSSFAEQFIQPITIYSKSTGFTNLMNIVDSIESDIGTGKVIGSEEWGYISIFKGSPFYQDKPEEDESFRAGYINLLVTIYQKGE